MNRKIFFYLVAAIILLLGSGFIYLNNNSPSDREALQLISDEDYQLISSAIEGVDKVLELDYRFTARIVTEPVRQFDTRLDTNKLRHLIDSFEQDEDRFTTINSVFSLLIKFHFKSVKPGVNPFEKGIYPNINSLRRMIVERGASEQQAEELIKIYQYQVIDGGKDFGLVAEFNTDEAIEFIKNSYNFFEDETIIRPNALPTIEGKKVTFSHNSFRKFDFKAIDYVHPIATFIFNQGLVFEWYQRDFDREVELFGALRKKGNDIAGTLWQRLTLNSSEYNREFILEERKIDDVLFQKIEKATGYDEEILSEQNIGKWEQLNPADELKYKLTNKFFELNQQTPITHLQLLADLVRMPEIDIRDLVATVQQKGNSTSYQLMLSRDTIIPFYNYILEMAPESRLANSNAYLNLDDESTLTLLKNDDLDVYLAYLVDNLTILLEIDHSTGKINHATYRLRIRPLVEEFKNEVILLETKLSLADLDGIPPIVVPNTMTQ